ncbi:hypothetical protein NQ166_09105 [Microbacterium sp. zg.Y1090]|uniref:hypothetical protein n=1 Tax=Microbacterium wangruii TaxID=3049073 RepID=UPI00214D6DCD|nr:MULTISPECIES: hypothetical protein [unclassified Microbacterium]MCR2818984.1 hypothetical protein [Microbacterium sp. zg.Y1090]WIM27289.1 hypothetical protein QNO26_08915 [Microbacterium sp. zg-Y1090]
MSAPRTRSIRRLLAVAAAGALVIGGAASPASATTGVGPVVFSAHTGTLPAVEPALGLGSALATDDTGRVALGAGVHGHTGALVRITVAAGTDPVTVFTGGAGDSIPVLSVEPGLVRSTTTLVRVSGGEAPLWATTPVDARVELIAGVSGRGAVYDEDDTLLTPGLPGSTVTLDRPVALADASTGGGGGVITPGDPAHITLTGIGGIPADNVRAAYVTVSVGLSEATTLTFDDVAMDLPAGMSVFTTIATPDLLGSVAASVTAGEAALGVWALGWVPDADDDHDSVSTAGGLEVVCDCSSEQVAVRAGVGVPLEVDPGADVAYTVALVQAEAATKLGAISVGDRVSGRAAGIAVDPRAGALPQLALIPADAPAQLTMSRGAASATVTVVGEILGEPAAGDEAASIAIVSHADDASVDLNATGFFTFAGTVTPGDTAIDRVEIAVDILDAPAITAEQRSQLADGGFITYADLTATAGESDLLWEATIGAPVDGTYRYTATVFDRSGASHAASATLRISAIVEGDATVTVHPDVLIVNTGDSGVPVMTRPNAAQPFVVEFAELPEEVFPGAILVSPVAPGFTDGFLGEVQRIERRDDVWVVTTVAAQIVDAILDAQHVATTPMTATEDTAPSLTALDEPLAATATDPATGELLDVEVRDDASGGGVLVEDPPLQGVSDKKVRYRATPGFYIIAGSGSGSGNVVVQSTGEYTPAQIDTVRERVIRQNVPQLFEAFLHVELDLTVDIHTVVDIRVSYKWKYIPKGVDVRELSVSAVADTSVDVELAANGSVKRKLQLAKPLDKVSLGEFTVWIGPVPVVFKNTITVTVDMEVDLQANVHVTDVGFRRQDEVGFRYRGLDSYVYLTRHGSQTLSPIVDGVDAAGTAELSGSLSAGPTVLVSSMIYGYLGPQLEFKPRADARGTLTHTNMLPSGRMVDLHVEMGVGATGRVFGKLEIWKFKLPFPSKTFIDERIRVWQHDWRWTL